MKLFIYQDDIYKVNTYERLETLKTAILGKYQLEPDIRVQNMPGIMAQGRDQQTEGAVKTLMEN